MEQDKLLLIYYACLILIVFFLGALTMHFILESNYETRKACENITRSFVYKIEIPPNITNQTKSI